MKHLKIFETMLPFLYDKDRYLLCCNSTPDDYHYSFSKGKKYKIEVLNTVTDDNGEIVQLNGFMRKINADFITYQYGDVEDVLTEDESLEDYNLRKNTEKYKI